MVRAARFIMLTWASLSLTLCFASAQERKADDIACGPHAVALASQLLGKAIPDSQLLAAFDGRLDGQHEMTQLTKAVRDLGLASRVVNIKSLGLHVARCPLIVLMRDSPEQHQADHFVVLYGNQSNTVQILDYPYAPRVISLASVGKLSDGKALLVGNTFADIWGPEDRLSFLLLVVSLVVCGAGVRGIVRFRRTATR